MCHDFFNSEINNSNVNLTRQPQFWLKANGHFDKFVLMPFNDGAFDQTWVGQNKGSGRVGAFDGGLLFWGKFSPTGAFSIQHFFPTSYIEPMVQRMFGKALFLEVMEDMGITLIV